MVLQTTLIINVLITSSVCVVSIFRVTSFDFNNLNDSTYLSIGPATWSSVEQSVGIICACLPTLRPFFRWLYGASKNCTQKRDSAQSGPPSRAPLSSRVSYGDEESALELPDSSLQQQVDKASTQELGAFPNKDCWSQPQEEAGGSHISQIFEDGEAEACIRRPESFA